MNLHKIGVKNKTDKSLYHEFMHFYESYIGFLKNEKIKLLEIGYFKGSSVLTWLEYFSNAQIDCIDIIDIDFKHDRLKYNKISQEDSRLTEIFQDSSFDLIIDDGRHVTSHQPAPLLTWAHSDIQLAETHRRL